uniref:AT-rich interactive domain-containing protein 3 n=1 Tax=Malurus cyaneus samueli TaxID=2593467 RepID=A0A8C5U060_9PASS
PPYNRKPKFPFFVKFWENQNLNSHFFNENSHFLVKFQENPNPNSHFLVKFQESPTSWGFFFETLAKSKPKFLFFVKFQENLNSCFSVKFQENSNSWVFFGNSRNFHLFPNFSPQNGGVSWSDDSDGSRGREISRDFAKLYELDSDPERKEFLDDLFIFMQKRGTPINRIPIMAKQILDLYMLYKLVTEKGGLVEIINKKIWREITKGLNLPTSITSAYMKYLYAYECEKKSLSSPAELQAAIDGNRREGRRPSYSSSLFAFSPSPPAPPSLLAPPKIRFPVLAVPPASGTGSSGGPRGSAAGRKGDGAVPLTVAVPSRLAVPVALGGPAAGRTAALEQLRERLEAGEPPEKKGARLTDEEQRMVQQALQRNLLSVARQIPMRIKINGKGELGPLLPADEPGCKFPEFPVGKGTGTPQSALHPLADSIVAVFPPQELPSTGSPSWPSRSWTCTCSTSW